MNKAKSGAALAAVLIVRDEARSIERCLRSVAPWVDRMLVLDTGSTDGTPALAAGCGAEVRHLGWPGDFSAARNHALDLADADWNLVIDADERLASGGEALRRWCEGPPRLGRLCVRSGFDGPGAAAGESRNWITRLLPRGVRYQGRIHEQPVSPLPRTRIDVMLAHDGYLHAQMGRKRGRNQPLLLRDLQDRPDDPYILFQLGREAEGRRDYPDACGRYAAALARTDPGANWLHELVMRHLHCLGQAGRADEGLGVAEALISTWADSPDFFFVLGELALARAAADPARALDQWLPLAATAWERCLEIGERPDLEGAVHGRGGHLARHNLSVIRSQLALLGAAAA